MASEPVSPVVQVNEDNFRDVQPKDVEGMVGLLKLDPVKYGIDPDGAKNLIRYFHYMLASEHLFERVQLNPVERAFLDFVGHAFERMTKDGESPQVAFGLQYGKGKYKRGDKADRDFVAVVHVILLMRNGRTWINAITEAAGQWFSDDKGEKTIEAAFTNHQKHQPYLWNLPDDVLIKMLPSDTLIIKPFMSG